MEFANAIIVGLLDCAFAVTAKYGSNAAGILLFVPLLPSDVAPVMLVHEVTET